MTEPRHSRRRVLSAGMAVGVLLVIESAAGCAAPAPQAPEQPDPLESPADRAESDVALAQQLAAAFPVLSPAATAFAADRQAHASALRGELRRVRTEPSPAPTGSAAPMIPAPAVAGVADARQALATAVLTARDDAAGLVATLPGYRAALLASVAACCASHAALLP